MLIPDKFKFIADDGVYFYTATLQDLNKYNVTWVEGDDEKSISYCKNTVKGFIKDSSWKILAESFKDIRTASDNLIALISEKGDASELVYGDLKALWAVRGLINRLLDDKQ